MSGSGSMASDADGAALMKKAEKAHTKTVFNWTADWASALMYYEQAANAFRKDISIKGHCNMVEALRQASNAAEQLSNANTAAKHLGTAAAACFKIGDKVQAVELLRSSAKLYHENTQARKAAEDLSKAAGWVRDENPDLAVKLYEQACEIYDIEDQVQMAADVYKIAVSFLARENRLDDAVKFLMKQNKGLSKHIGKFAEAFYKNCLSVCILYLSLRDTSHAINALQEFQSVAPDFSNSSEYMCASGLVSAFENCDVDALVKAKSDRTLSYIDNQIARLVRDLAIDDDAREAAKKVTQPNLAEGDEVDLT
uniref:Gamma-soluble NSF attachment protein n=1 Tax=Spongospora subterranea TaxID=70186 RepID=A0A0H5RAC5_9EUKA|eukprot:CRZ11105.1 hypothetical protein [Spongospora subterranea]